MFFDESIESLASTITKNKSSSMRCYAMDGIIIQWFNDEKNRNNESIVKIVVKCMINILLDYQRVNVIDGLLGIKFVCQLPGHHLLSYLMTVPRISQQIEDYFMKQCNLKLYGGSNENINEKEQFNETFWNENARVIESFLFETAQYAPSESNYFYLRQLYTFDKFEKDSKIYYLPYIALYRKEKDIAMIEEIIYRQYNQSAKKTQFGKEWRCAMDAIANFPNEKFWDYLMDFYMKIYQYISKVNGETVPDNLYQYQPNLANQNGMNNNIGKHLHNHDRIRGLSESESKLSDISNNNNNNEDNNFIPPPSDIDDDDDDDNDDGKDDSKDEKKEEMEQRQMRQEQQARQQEAISQSEGTGNARNNNNNDDNNNNGNDNNEEETEIDDNNGNNDNSNELKFGYEQAYNDAIMELDDIHIHTCLISTLCAYANDNPFKYGTNVAGYIDHLLDIKKINTRDIGFYEDKRKEILLSMPYDNQHLSNIFLRIWNEYYFMSWQYVDILTQSWKDIKNFQKIFLLGTLNRREFRESNNIHPIINNRSCIFKISGEKGVLKMIHSYLYDNQLKVCMKLLKNEFNVIWQEPPYYEVYRTENFMSLESHFQKDSSDEEAIVKSIESVLEMFIYHKVKERFLLYEKLKELKYISYLVNAFIVPKYDAIFNEGPRLAALNKGEAHEDDVANAVPSKDNNEKEVEIDVGADEGEGAANEHQDSDNENDQDGIVGVSHHR